MTDNDKEVFIPQRHVGIIAPEQDPYKVRSLWTYGLGTCFGLGLYDRQRNVGLFSHVDNEDRFLGSFPHFATQLRIYGATTLRIETANNRGGRGFIRELVELLDSENFLVDPHPESKNPLWKDISGINVRFKPTNGITALSWEEFETLYDSQEDAGAWITHLLSMISKGSFHRLPYRILYQPRKRILRPGVD